MTKNWTFFGVVHPERVPFTLPKPFEGKAHNLGLDCNFEFKVRIHASQIIIDLSVENDEIDAATLRNLAVSNAEVFTDLIGYETACCFNVEIKSAVCHSDESWFVFGIDIPALSQGRASKPRELDADILNAVGANPGAQMVLADFTNAMRFPVGTGFYGYRAIEAMMQLMKAGENEKDDKGWARLRERLRIDRASIDAVKAHADLPRHGKPNDIGDDERAYIFTITDEIIRRFLVYLKNGQEPLLEADYATLMPPHDKGSESGT